MSDDMAPLLRWGTLGGMSTLQELREKAATDLAAWRARQRNEFLAWRTAHPLEYQRQLTEAEKPHEPGPWYVAQEERGQNSARTGPARQDAKRARAAWRHSSEGQAERQRRADAMLEREMQVLRWWREGLTQREIGRRLNVSAERARQLLMRALQRRCRDDGEWGDYARYVLAGTPTSPTARD